MYDLIAKYYDLFHSDLVEDIGFVLTLAGQSGGPVLELGCGTGRILIPLARAGQTVTGLDSSEPMLALARAKTAAESDQVQKRIFLKTANMKDFDLNERFSLIVIPYNTFMHIDPVTRPMVLRRVCQHLSSTGTLFIDLASPFDIEQTPNDRMMTLEKVVTDPTNKKIVIQMASSWVDTEAQTLHITWIFDRSPAAGGSIHRHVAQVAYHYSYPHEMELMLDEAGLQLKALYGDYRGSDYQEGSERLLIVATNS
jgi:SAM-dependent methyltransferase